MKSIIKVPNFSQEVPKLRKHFDHVFRDPRISDGRRFQFDFWHIENQYTLHRTLARTFFPKAEMNRLILALQKFGQENFGCYSISEPWLSFYTEGCRQELHTDDPHGPWAYVLSLTPPTRVFTGGETMILRDSDSMNRVQFNQQTNRKRQTSKSRLHTGSEFLDLFELIEPKFNQLLAFNPRAPHGVREVRGTFDPREARLVLHGWFVEPKPYVTGGLRKQKIDSELQDLVATISQLIPEDIVIEGISTLALDILPSGKVRKAQFLTENLTFNMNLKEAAQSGIHLRALLTNIRKEAQKLSFPRCQTTSRIILPLVFS